MSTLTPDRESFIRHCYLKTGGWLPVMPLGQQVELGDFCQIAHGDLRSLGNIFRLNGVGDGDSCLGELSFELDERNWKLSTGVTQSYCATEQEIDDSGQTLVRTKQELQFAGPGSFLFHGSRPACHVLTNWSDFETDITIQLTQRAFAFRHLYVITHLVTVDNWALAIAKDSNAQLRMFSELKENDYFQLFSHPSSKVEQSTNMDTYLRSDEQPAKFFKAKKLVLKQKKRDEFLTDILQARDNHQHAHRGLGDQDLTRWLDSDLLNLVESNELNLTTCMDYFTWADTTLDEAEMLC